MLNRKKPLLVAQDVVKPEAPVLDRAIWLASKLGMRIDLVHVEDLAFRPAETSFYREIFDRVLKERKAALKQLAGRAKVAVRPVLVEGIASDKIVELSDDASAVVMGTHGRRGLGRLFLGSVSEEVIRRARVPVMVLGPKAMKRGRAGVSEQASLLVGTDLGPNSRRAELFALELAEALGARVRLLHCLHESLHPVMQSALATSRGRRELAGMLEESRREVERKLAKRTAQFEARGIECETIVDEQSRAAQDALLREARRGEPSLIVLGTHGRNLAAQAFFGSTLRKTILGAAVPVFVVRSRG